MTDVAGRATTSTRFGPIEVAYDDEVLAPRPWTIAQAEWAIQLSATIGPGPILELCAGAGHIGLVVALAAGRPLVQVDASERACALAAHNAARAGVESVVRCIDIDDLVPGTVFPLILADPPYVPTDETAGHPADPSHAIDGGEDGLDLAVRCLRVAAEHLAPGGSLLIQLRDAQQAAALGLEDVRVIGDHGCIARLRAS